MITASDIEELKLLNQQFHLGKVLSDLDVERVVTLVDRVDKEPKGIGVSMMEMHQLRVFEAAVVGQNDGRKVACGATDRLPTGSRVRFIRRVTSPHNAKHVRVWAERGELGTIASNAGVEPRPYTVSIDEVGAVYVAAHEIELA